MRRILVLIMLIITATSVIASDVRIYKLHYDRGNINIVESTIVEGFAPDRKIQPEKGHLFQLFNTDGAKIDEFRFKVPLVLFTDRSIPGLNLEGGYIILNETDFALTTEHNAEEDVVRIYNENNQLVLKEEISEKQSPTNYSFIWWIAALAVIAIAATAYYLIKHRR